MSVPPGPSREKAPTAPNYWPAGFTLLAAIWGLSFVFIKEADQALAPVQVALARLGVGTVTLLVVLAVIRQPLPRGRRVWAHLALIGLLQNLLPFTLFAYGETQISSVLAGIWNAATPLFTLVVAMLMLPGEGPTRSRVAGILVGFLGVVVVLGPWRGLGGGQLLLGSLAALGAAACYGLGTPYMRRYLTGLSQSGASLAAGQLLCATAEAAVLAALTWRRPGSFTPPVLGSILALGAFGTGLAYILYFSVIRTAGATTASMVTYLIPLFSTIAGILLLGERLTWNEPVGGVVILFGVALSQGLAARVVRARQRGQVSTIAGRTSEADPQPGRGRRTRLNR